MFIVIECAIKKYNFQIAQLNTIKNIAIEKKRKSEEMR